MHPPSLLLSIPLASRPTSLILMGSSSTCRRFVLTQPWWQVSFPDSLFLLIFCRTSYSLADLNLCCFATMSNSDSGSEFLAAGMALAYMSVPDAYGVVEAGVYRSKALELHNLPFLLHLQLRTVLYLSNDSLVRPVIDFLNNHTIKLVWLDPSNCWPWNLSEWDTVLDLERNSSLRCIAHICFFKYVRVLEQQDLHFHSICEMFWKNWGYCLLFLPDASGCRSLDARGIMEAHQWGAYQVCTWDCARCYQPPYPCHVLVSVLHSKLFSLSCACKCVAHLAFLLVLFCRLQIAGLDCDTWHHFGYVVMSSQVRNSSNRDCGRLPSSPSAMEPDSYLGRGNTNNSDIITTLS